MADNKCVTCKVMAKIRKNNSKPGSDLACCKWFMDNVVCGNKTSNDCPEYKPVKKK